MTAFNQPLDIVNRALQHLELPRVGSLQDSNLAASEMAFAYDKVRRRELRRNLWRFATRRVCLRPAASTSVLLTPAPWVPGTYPGGSIVSDNSNNLWVSLRNNNSGIPGQAGSGWDQYFGPLIVTPWGQPVPPTSLAANPYQQEPGVQIGSFPTQQGVSYYPGELAFLPDGKGNITIFQALQPTQGSPFLQEGPNQIEQWQPGITYSKGQIAFIYTNAEGQMFLGVGSGGPSGTAPTVFIPGISILGGPDVLGSGGGGGGSSGGSGGLGVGDLSENAYQSTIDFNTGNQPDVCTSDAGIQWTPTHTFSLGDIAVGSDTQLYVSLIANNLGNDPTTDALFASWLPLGMYSGTWTPVISPVPRAISNQWQLIPGTAASMVIPYPLTAGPLDNMHTRNAYRLPAGFLREAPSDPTQGGTPWLGAPLYTTVQQDWTYEGNFIVTANNQPLIYRFIADVTDVTMMDDMFCEGLAATLAMVLAPTLQPKRPDLVTATRTFYKDNMFEARTVNAIEIGGVKPPPDDYLVVRL